jgi:hypothetical protein
MSGAGIGSAGSTIQQAWDFIASLPDVLVYGMAVVLGLIVLKGLWPSPTIVPTGQPVAATSPATSSSPSDQDSSGFRTSAAADDAPSKVDTEEEPAAAAASTAEEDQSTSTSENEPQEEAVQLSSDPMDPPIANPEQMVFDGTGDHSLKYTTDSRKHWATITYPPISTMNSKTKFRNCWRLLPGGPKRTTGTKSNPATFRCRPDSWGSRSSSLSYGL